MLQQKLFERFCEDMGEVNGILHQMLEGVLLLADELFCKQENKVLQTNSRGDTLN